MKARAIIDSAIEFTASAAAEKWAKSYIYLMNALKIVAVLMLVASLAMDAVGATSASLLLTLGVIVVVIVYFGIKLKWTKSFQDLLLVKCDPVTYVDRCYALSRYSRQKTAPTEMIWNFCRALLYSGRNEEVLRVINAYRPYLAAPIDEVRYNALLILYAYNTYDKALLDEAASAFVAVRNTRPLSSKEKDKTAAYLQYQLLYDLETNGNLSTLLGIYASSQYGPQFQMAHRVEFQYRIACVAQRLGENEIANNSFDFVARNGNTMFVAQKAREALGNKLPS